MRHHSKQQLHVPGLYQTHGLTAGLSDASGYEAHTFHNVLGIADENVVVDPFETLYHDDAMEECYTMRDDYADVYMAKVKDDATARAGGFNVAVTYLRSLEAAFRGLFAAANSAEPNP
jgi:hypothetical protein